jgi:hypothetical protein
MYKDINMQLTAFNTKYECHNSEAVQTGTKNEHWRSPTPLKSQKNDSIALKRVSMEERL